MQTTSWFGEEVDVVLFNTAAFCLPCQRDKDEGKKVLTLICLDQFGRTTPNHNHFDVLPRIARLWYLRQCIHILRTQATPPVPDKDHDRLPPRLHDGTKVDRFTFRVIDRDPSRDFEFFSCRYSSPKFFFSCSFCCALTGL